MKRLLAAAAVLTAMPAAVFAQDIAVPQLSLEHRTMLRCSAAFALVAEAQQHGWEGAAQWPAMGERGREFFVRAVVLVMDRAALSREQVTAALLAERDAIVAGGTLAQVMPPCLTLLPDEQPVQPGASENR